MMFKFISGFVLITIALVQNASATNYCTICANHIACNNNGKLQSTCPAGAAIVTLTNDLINLILSRHNSLRNGIANGSVSPFPTASRMATTQWNSELAQVAQDNANRCIFGHDSCRQTDAFHWAGQNIASSGTTGKINIPSMISSMINSWYNEYKNTNLAQIKSYSTPTDGSENGHFTAMINQKQTHIGCGVVTYLSGRFNTVYLVCNYAFTNVINYPVYASGPACSQCTTGCNPQYRALCNPGEPISVNP